MQSRIIRSLRRSMISAICLAAERSFAVSGLPNFEVKQLLFPATRCHFGVINRDALNDSSSSASSLLCVVCNLAGQQSGNLLFGRVTFEDADSVDVFGQHCDLPVGQARAEIGGCRVEAGAAALCGPAFFGLGQQLRFALLALRLLRLPMTGVVGDFGNGGSDFGHTGQQQLVGRRIRRITGEKILECLIDAALLLGRDGTVGQPTVVLLLFVGDVSASFGGGQVAMFDFALHVVQRKAVVLEHFGGECQPAHHADCSVQHPCDRLPCTAEPSAFGIQSGANGLQPLADFAVGAPVRQAYVFDAGHGCFLAAACRSASSSARLARRSSSRKRPL